MRRSVWAVVLVVALGPGGCKKEVSDQERAAERELAWAADREAEEKRAQTARVAASAAEREAQRVEAQRQTSRDLTPSGRVEALRAACALGVRCAQPLTGFLLAAARDDAEARSLERLQRSLEAASLAKVRAASEEAVMERDFLHGEIVRSFFAKPDSQRNFTVATNGPGKTRMVITAPFCSAEFLAELLATPPGSLAFERGFTRVECVSPTGAWHRDL